MKLSLPFLQTLGLSESEIALYELLLKLGPSPASVIISESKLKRPTVYKTLYTLEEKGLLSQQDHNKKLLFTPESPSKLLELADQQYQTLDRVKENLGTIVPQLISAYMTTTEKPVVKVYEGFEGLKEIYEDTLRVREPIYAVLQTAEVEPQMFDWLNRVYAKKRTRAKIHAKVIVASGKWSHEYQKEDIENYRTTILVDSALFPFQHEVNIYGDKVAFINWRKDEPLIGIVITHPQIAKTMGAWFDLAWIGAEASRN